MRSIPAKDAGRAIRGQLRSVSLNRGVWVTYVVQWVSGLCTVRSGSNGWAGFRQRPSTLTKSQVRAVVWPHDIPVVIEMKSESIHCAIKPSSVLIGMSSGEPRLYSVVDIYFCAVESSNINSFEVNLLFFIQFSYSDALPNLNDMYFEKAIYNCVVMIPWYDHPFSESILIKCVIKY